MPKDTTKPFNVDNVRVSKILGSGVLSSTVMKGMVFKRQIDTEITHIEHAKVGAFVPSLRPFTEAFVSRLPSTHVPLTPR